MYVVEVDLLHAWGVVFVGDGKCDDDQDSDGGEVPFVLV